MPNFRHSATNSKDPDYRESHLLYRDVSYANHRNAPGLNGWMFHHPVTGVGTSIYSTRAVYLSCFETYRQPAERRHRRLKHTYIQVIQFISRRHLYTFQYVMRHITTDYHCIAVIYNAIIHTVTTVTMLPLRHLRTTPHISPSRASYGVPFLKSTKKYDHHISRAHCIIQTFGSQRLGVFFACYAYMRSSDKSSHHIEAALWWWQGPRFNIR